MSGTSLQLLGPGETLFFKPTRMLGFIIPDCAIEERHLDRMQVTQHPVETGANISDHAFLLPFEVSVRYGWWDGAFAFEFGHAAEIYGQLQQLMKNRQPFDITTGKRIYHDMLITEMETTSDQHTENVLIVEMRCQQIFIVETRSVPASTLGSSDQADHTLPERTAPQVSVGQQQLSAPSTPSITGLTSGPLVPLV